MRRIINRLEGMSSLQAWWLIVIVSLGLWSVIALLATGLPALASWVRA